MQQLINTITTLVDEIPSGFYFDSHHIINLLIKNHSDIYNLYANPTLPKHGNIGKIINTLQTVDYIGQSLSLNIHENTSECALWRKL
jgi:hypothetical protein